MTQHVVQHICRTLFVHVLCSKPCVQPFSYVVTYIYIPGPGDVPRAKPERHLNIGEVLILTLSIFITLLGCISWYHWQQG